MSRTDATDQAVEALQELGLKEYEAKCFVGLSRLDMGTAKRLSEVTDVPRTRVYDAIRVLEAQGLVEVQHSNPQRFRAVPLGEATETLRDQYESRVDRLASALERTEDVASEQEDTAQEIWSMAGSQAIENRTQQLIEDTTDEVVLGLGEQSLLTDELVTCLTGIDEETELFVGTVSESLQEQIHAAVPDARTFVSGLGGLQADDASQENLAIGRLLLADRSAILVSTLVPDTGEEHAIFGTGFRNGLVVIARRLMAQGLVPARDSSR
ncbi:TrmB family transcriptional regulator [Haloplanus halobius]|uniref:TrmB family transcriptional regulator n=1 Tax=Haloplanus halobius TaxID=2934938 RepID=UPI0020100AC5|nr:helix-turn-helix domain-containing protein [Haloplanus sp. XH21]